MVVHRSHGSRLRCGSWLARSILITGTAGFAFSALPFQVTIVVLGPLLALVLDFLALGFSMSKPRWRGGKPPGAVLGHALAVAGIPVWILNFFVGSALFETAFRGGSLLGG